VGGERSVRESSDNLRVLYFEKGLNLEAVDENVDVLEKLHRLVVGAEDVEEANPADGRRPNGRLGLVGED
jgi:hypothetical protein